MQAVYDGLANAQPQTGALRKAVFFVKAFEDMFLGVFRDTASRVFDKDGGISFPVRDVAEGVPDINHNKPASNGKKRRFIII